MDIQKRYADYEKLVNNYRYSTETELSKHMWKLKNKERALQRGKITRNINRVRKFIDQGAEMRKRVEKEMIEILKNFELARQCDSEMYEFVDEGQNSALDDWGRCLSQRYLRYRRLC